MKHSLGAFIFLILVIILASCQSAPARDKTLELTTSTENNVKVTITLEHGNNGQAVLLATFTPQDPSLHLYSKEIPKKGLGGLGRPTLLELTEGSSITATGGLSESVHSQPPSSGPSDLLVYPEGPVTLSIPVTLPDGKIWINDQVIVTYMACSEQGCRPPVEGKVIPIRIPGKDIFNQ